MTRHIVVVLLVGMISILSFWVVGRESAALSLTSHVETELLQQVPSLGYEIVAEYPHDSLAFTQGLKYAKGFMYESTGQRGYSSLRKVELQTGVVKQQHDLSARIFAEGLTLKDETLVQLSWRAGKAMKYSVNSLDELGYWRYSGEGWGLEFKDDEFLMSDGSDVLVFRSADDFNIQRSLSVKVGTEPLEKINELEWIGDKIVANVWLSANIAVINASSGQVASRIDLQPLLDRIGELASPDAVANGIAYDADRDWLFVTGKLWPTLFALKLHHSPWQVSTSVITE